MKTHLKLRTKITIVYGIVLGVIISVISVYFYKNVEDNLYQHVDMSIEQVGNSFYDILVNQVKIGDIYNNITYTVNKVKGTKDANYCVENNSQVLQLPNKRVIQKNPIINTLDSLQNSLDTLVKNSNKINLLREKAETDAQDFYVLISERANGFSWCSDNLHDTLRLASFLKALKIEHHDKFEFVRKILKNDNTNYELYYFNVFVNGQPIRICQMHVKNSDIIVGYSLKNLDKSLSRLLIMLILFIPATVLFTCLGVLVCLNYPFKKIEAISKITQKLSGANLSDRFVVEKHNELTTLESSLNSMLDRFEDTFQHLKKFNSDTAHELKTPLTILRGELSLALQNTKKPEEFAQVISSALDEVIRLSDIVETILELSRAEVGNLKLNLNYINISKIIDDIAEDAEILAEEKEIRVKSEIRAGVFCFADSDRIHQAVLNIIENAVKYTYEGGKIQISLWEEQEYAVIEIKDTGIGIPQNQIDKIFDRFFRSDNAKASNLPGMGLGLALVKWIIDLHHGEISVSSEVNKGSSFILKIPVKSK